MAGESSLDSGMMKFISGWGFGKEGSGTEKSRDEKHKGNSGEGIKLKPQSSQTRAPTDGCKYAQLLEKKHDWAFPHHTTL